MKRNILQFLSGAAAAMCFVHVAYAVAASKGIISVPIYRGRRWGVGKMWTEAVAYGAVSVGLGYLSWRSEPRQVLPAPPMNGSHGSTDQPAAVSGGRP